MGANRQPCPSRVPGVQGKKAQSVQLARPVFPLLPITMASAQHLSRGSDGHQVTQLESPDAQRGWWEVPQADAG